MLNRLPITDFDRGVFFAVEVLVRSADHPAIADQLISEMAWDKSKLLALIKESGEWTEEEKQQLRIFWKK